MRALLVAVCALDAHMRAGDDAHHPHHAHKKHHAHSKHHEHADNAAMPASLASQEAVQQAPGSGSQLLAGLLGTSPKKAADILEEMAAEQKKHFVNPTHGEKLDGCVGSACDPYVATDVIENTKRKAYNLLYGDKGGVIADSNDIQDGPAASTTYNNIRERWRSASVKSNKVKETATRARWGFANTPFKMNAMTEIEGNLVDWLVGTADTHPQGDINAKNIKQYEADWKNKLEADAGGDFTSVKTALEDVTEGAVPLHTKRKADFVDGPNPSCSGESCEQASDISGASMKGKEDALNKVFVGLVGDRNMDSSDPRYIDGTHDGAINTIRVNGDEAIKAFADKSAEYLKVGEPGTAAGVLCASLEELSNLYEEEAKSLIETRRQDYLGEMPGSIDMEGGLSKLQPGVSSFGKGGISGEIFDYRKKLKQSMKEHMNAAQAFAGMGAELEALINAAKVRIEQDYVTFRAKTRREDKKAVKEWFKALDGRNGAFPKAKQAIRDTVAEAMSASEDNGFKKAENQYLDAKNEMVQLQADGFRDARKAMSKAGQSATTLEMSAEKLDDRVKAAQSILDDETGLAASDGQYIKDFKDTMDKTVEDESDQVPGLFEDLKTLGESAVKDAEQQLTQYGNEQQEEVSTAFNGVAHKLRQIREDQESTFKEQVERINKLVKPENAPNQEALKALRAKVVEIETLLGKTSTSTGDNYRDDALKEQIEAHEATVAADLASKVAEVEAALTRLGYITSSAGGAYAPDSSDSKVGLAYAALSTAQKEFEDPETGEGQIKTLANEQAKEINRQIDSYQSKMQYVKQAEEKTKAEQLAALTQADNVDKQLERLLQTGGTIQTQKQKVEDDVAGITADAEDAAKHVQGALLNANRDLDASVEQAVTQTAQKADSLEESSTAALKSTLENIEGRSKNTVEQAKALKAKADTTLEHLEQGGGSGVDAVEEGRVETQQELTEAEHKQTSNTHIQDQALKSFRESEQRRIKDLKEDFDALQKAIPVEYNRTYFGAKTALGKEQADLEKELTGPGGKLEANRNTVNELKVAAAGVAEESLHTVKKDAAAGTARVKEMNHAYDSVTQKYSEEELGALAQADVLYKELDKVRHDLSAASILSLGTKEEQLAKLAEREKETLSKLHKVTGDMDVYARTKVNDAVIRANKEMADILKSEELSDEEKQKKLEEIEKALQGEITSVVGSGTDAEKTLHLLGMKIDDDVKDKVKAQLKESAEVQEGLSEEAKERAAQGGDDNAVLDSKLTDAEKITSVLQKVESSAGAMLHGQEMRWREKLQASTAHLSEALGKDLKLGVDEVKELAGQAVNNSDRLAYEISSDRRQLESAVKGMQEDLASSQAYIGAHVDEEQKEVDALQQTVPGGVEGPMKELANKLDTIFQGAVDMHTHIQGAMLSSQHDAAETEEALEKAATFEVHDEDAAKEFIPKAHALLARHAATAGWFAAYEAGDLAFKRAVAKKLGELGHDIDMGGLDGASRLTTDDLDSELSAELDANQKRMAKQLNAMYADSDRRIAALRADESLSAEERNRLIAEIEAENRKKAAGLFAQQEQMKQRQAALEGALAKYQTKVAEAENLAKAAVAAGVLSPTAIDTSRKLANANIALARVRMKPLFSAIELRSFGVDPSELSRYVDHLGQLHKANSILAKKDADLQARVEHLERILQA